MKRGTFIINPYVKPYYDDTGEPNPNYKTMFWKKTGDYAKCIAYNGQTGKYYYKDVITWETDGCADIEAYLKSVFGIKDDKWKQED